MNPRTVHRLLDTGEAASLLSPLAPGGGPEGLALESVWAKPGRHFNVCYRARDGGLLSLCIVDARDGEKAMRRRAAGSASAGAPAAAEMVAGDVLAQAFPFDYRLDALGECLDAAAVSAVLGGPAIEACEVVAYRPGMRCLLRYRDGDRTRAYGKIAVDREPGRRGRVQRALCAATSNAAMRVPAPLGSVAATGLDLVEAVEGESLHDILAAGPHTGRVVETARALAELHATVEGPDDRIHASGDELSLLRTWTEWMSGLDETLAPSLGAAFHSIESAAPATAPRGFAHRDFYDKQVLFDGSRLWLLDVDTACKGDPELDLGNFLAQLFLRGLQWDRADAHRGLEVQAELAYGAGARAEVTRWYRRASLLRLACVYRLRPRWQHLVGGLLAEVMQP